MTNHGQRGSGSHGNGLTRRDALKLAGAAGAAASLGHWAPTRARQATPAGERPTLRVGVAGTTETLDPHVAGRNQRTLVIRSIFDGPIERDFLGGTPPGTGTALSPALATTWNRLDDLTLELSLREGVTFHDGTPVTADDVKFTYDLIRSDTVADYTSSRVALETVAGVEVVDPTTIRVVTATPDPILEKRLASYYAWVVPRRAFEAVGPEAFGLKPVGTGPYKVVEFRPDDALILEAHDGYWGGTPTAARIEFRVIPELAARIAALISGEVDLIATVSPDQVGAIEAAGGYEVRGVPVANNRLITFNTRHPAMGDRRLRQALGLAIDRQLIIDQLWGGRAVLPRGFQFPDYGELYNPERPTPVYDPERARELIREAGYDGAPLPLWTPTDYYTLGEEVAQAVAAMWQAVGVNVELGNGPVAEFYDNMDRKAAVSDSYGDRLGDPDEWWFLWGEGSEYDAYTWTPADPRFNELGRRARSMLDQTARFGIYQEMLDIFEDEAPATVLYSPIESYGVRQGVRWTPYSAYLMDFRPSNLAFG